VRFHNPYDHKKRIPGGKQPAGHRGQPAGIDWRFGGAGLAATAKERGGRKGLTLEGFHLTRRNPAGGNAAAWAGFPAHRRGVLDQGAWRFGPFSRRMFDQVGKPRANRPGTRFVARTCHCSIRVGVARAGPPLPLTGPEAGLLAAGSAFLGRGQWSEGGLLGLTAEIDFGIRLGFERSCRGAKKSAVRRLGARPGKAVAFVGKENEFPALADFIHRN